MRLLAIVERCVFILSRGISAWQNIKQCFPFHEQISKTHTRMPTHRFDKKFAIFDVAVDRICGVGLKLAILKLKVQNTKEAFIYCWMVV